MSLWPRLARPQRYWGLHAPPQQLDTVVRAALKVRRSRQRNQAWVTASPGGTLLPTAAADAADGAWTTDAQEEEAQVAAVMSKAKEAFARYLATVRASVEVTVRTQTLFDCSVSGGGTKRWTRPLEPRKSTPYSHPGSLTT
jgi:hypothetical protein